MRERFVVLASLSLAALAALAGCNGIANNFVFERSPQGAIRYDYDGDGFAGPWVCPTGVSGCDEHVLNSQPIANLDCDDHNAKTYPGAPDTPGDGIDSNCDGIDGILDRQDATPKGALTLPNQPPAKSSLGD